MSSEKADFSSDASGGARADSGPGPTGGQQVTGGTVGGNATDALGQGGQPADTDAITGPDDGGGFPKPDGQRPDPDDGVAPLPEDAGPPPTPDARINPGDDAFVAPTDDATVIVLPDVGVEPRPDAAVIDDPDGPRPPTGGLRLAKARIVWTGGPLGFGQGVGTSTVTRNGFLRLTGRVVFAAGGQPP